MVVWRGQAQSALLAVFDGHGGDFVCRTAANLLPDVFQHVCKATCPADPPAALREVRPRMDECAGPATRTYVRYAPHL